MHGALVPVQKHLVAGLGRAAAAAFRQVGLQLHAGGVDFDAREGAEILRLGHHARGAGIERRAEADSLGAQHRGRPAGEVPCRGTVEHVGCADELRDETRGRRVVDALRCADLFQPALIEHADAVAHRQCFVLVVRDEQERDAELPLQRLQLALHLLAQLQVQGPERLVEQQHLRLIDQRTRKRHALALTARQLGRTAFAHA